MPDIHSPLSPSSAFRWIKCTPSAKLNAALPDSTSEYALQGTAAHTLCEYKLRKLLGKDAKDPTENLTYFDAEMADCTDSYQQYVSEQIEKAKQFCKGPIVLVEQKLDFSKWVPQGFGTGDCVIVADNVLTCRKRAEYNLELARYDFEMPANLEDTEIEVILSKADELAAWCSDIKEYAFQQALNGKQWNGWKLVEGRSVRKYINEDAVAETVKNAGYDPYEHKVLGITAMTRMLGKAKFENLLSSFIEKPTGKPALVPKSDKRPSINKAVQAADDFKEENES